MDVEIIDEDENPMLHRTDVRFQLAHEEATPSRLSVRDSLAAKLNKDASEVVVHTLDTKYGMRKSVGYAKVYETSADALEVEQEYVLERNKISGDGEVQTAEDVEPEVDEDEATEPEVDEEAEEDAEAADESEEAEDEEADADDADDEGDDDDEEAEDEAAEEAAQTEEAEDAEETDEAEADDEDDADTDEAEAESDDEDEAAEDE